jgi:hypothetical protein
MRPEQITRSRARQRVENMTPKLIQRRRARAREANLSGRDPPVPPERWRAGPTAATARRSGAQVHGIGAKHASATRYRGGAGCSPGAPIGARTGGTGCPLRRLTQTSGSRSRDRHGVIAEIANRSATEVPAIETSPGRQRWFSTIPALWLPSARGRSLRSCATPFGSWRRPRSGSSSRGRCRRPL